jgi:DNA primase
MYLDIQRMKAEITMEHILGHYGIRLRAVNSHRLSGCCPIHHGDNANAFHVDLKQNLFHCFTHCGGGSIFDFVMKMEQLDFYPAARKIWDTFYPSAQSVQTRINFLYCTKSNNAPWSLFTRHTLPKENLLARPGVPILKLQPNHPYLRKRNISPALAMFFHMGYCRYGMMKNRIAIPIMDMEQHIVAYAGRTTHNDQSPRYLFPKNFKKSQHLFNIQRIQPIHSSQRNPRNPHIQPLDQHGNKPVFLVEGFFACIHIVKAGFEAVSLMGTTVSSYQLDMMKQTRRFYLLMMDGDEAGRKATTIIEQKLTLFQIPFRTINLMEGKQPDELDYDYLKRIAENKMENEM